MKPEDKAYLDHYYNTIRTLTAAGLEIPEEIYRAINAKLNITKQQQFEDWLKACPEFLIPDVAPIIHQHFPEYFV